MMEIWKTIKDYPLYQVSIYGRVRSKNNKWKNLNKYKMLKPSYIGRYLTVGLCKNSKQKRFSIHKLVLVTFSEENPKGMHCCHNDGNKRNNSLNNLRWATPKENNDDKRKHGTWQEGVTGANSRLKASEVIEIRRLFRKGIEKIIISKMFKITMQNVLRIVKKETWRFV